MRQHRKDKSLFQLLDRKRFDALVKKWGTDKWATELSTWEFTCALINVLVMRLGSYREVEATLGIPRSTFGDAICRRDFGFFQDLCDVVLEDIRAKTSDRKTKKAIRQILAIDSTECRVHGSLFSELGWELKLKLPCVSGHLAGAKLHVVWNVDGQWIEDFRITPVRRSDSPVSLQFRLEENKIYVFDRGYNDFDFWLKIIGNESDFVTRLKEFARNRWHEVKALAENGDKDGVLYDGKYTPSRYNEAKLCRERKLHFRHIIYRDPDTKKVFHFVTSNLHLPGQAIADIYKKRWSVELLFRWLKGHLNIRHLGAKNKNAAKTQFAMAVLIKLLLQLKKLSDNLNGTLWDILRSIRSNLNRQALTKAKSPDDCRWKSARNQHYTACTL